MRRVVPTAFAILVAMLAIGGCANSQAPSTGGGSQPASVQETPVPTEVATPTPALATFDPITLTGRGPKVPKFAIPEGAAAIATITHTGSSNFVVTTLAADGTEGELLVNAIGNYSGTVLFDASTSAHSVAFKIEADGSWTIIIKPVTAARAWDGVSKLSGKGDEVVLLSPPTSGLTVGTFTHGGQANFVVSAYSGTGAALLVNEIGHFTGDVPLPQGTYLLQITADGAWTVTAS